MKQGDTKYLKHARARIHGTPYLEKGRYGVTVEEFLKYKDHQSNLQAWPQAGGAIDTTKPTSGNRQVITKEDDDEP